ncbi:MAG: hypothetical protein K2K84_06565 [Muribaculaceae bacterium]|nr:hypothetical protein [Muribaculaceae bacterium]
MTGPVYGRDGQAVAAKAVGVEAAEGSSNKDESKDGYYSKWDIEVFIPVEKMDKYSKFWIEYKE